MVTCSESSSFFSTHRKLHLSFHPNAEPTPRHASAIKPSTPPPSTIRQPTSASRQPARAGRDKTRRGHKSLHSTTISQTICQGFSASPSSPTHRYHPLSTAMTTMAIMHTSVRTFPGSTGTSRRLEASNSRHHLERKTSQKIIGPSTFRPAAKGCSALLVHL